MQSTQLRLTESIASDVELMFSAIGVSFSGQLTEETRAHYHENRREELFGAINDGSVFQLMRRWCWDWIDDLKFHDVDTFEHQTALRAQQMWASGHYRDAFELLLRVRKGNAGDRVDIWLQLELAHAP